MSPSARIRSSISSLPRDIAQKFNNDFGAPDFFPQPEPVITGPATRVMSLRDGTKKMSKSDESDNSRINLTDDAEAIAQKIRSAKTDPHPLPDSKKELEGRPEAENLVNIYAALSDGSQDSVIAQFAGQQFSAFKNALADLAVDKLVPLATGDAAAAGRSRRDRPHPAHWQRKGAHHRHTGDGRSQTPGRLCELKSREQIRAHRRMIFMPLFGSWHAPRSACSIAASICVGDRVSHSAARIHCGACLLYRAA